jgi:hypothetical protein
MDKHLWEVKHNYHASGEHGESYESFSDYLDEFDGADPDYNLIFRWDWHDFKTAKDADYHGFYNGTIAPYESDDKINGILKIYIVAQRHGYVIESIIKVCRADEPKVIEYLNKGKDYLFNLWNPL